MSGLVDRGVASWHLRGRDASKDHVTLPDPSRQAGADRLPEIEHIVLLMMENHSFDNYLGTLGRGDGFSDDMPVNRDRDGNVISPHHLTSTLQGHDVPTQSWHASHIQYDGGRNDGFVKSVEETVPGGDARIPMGYFTEADLPFYAGLARTFPLADRWFCSCLGPTFPNRRFLLAATAHGLIDDVALSMVDYPATGTILDLLDRHGISWADYHHVSRLGMVIKHIGLRGWRSIGMALGNIWPGLVKATQGNIQFTADLYPLGALRCLRHLRSAEQFFEDAATGRLPSVSIVDPDFQAGSEENPQDVQLGEGFAAAVIGAVMKGPAWDRTLLIWFYDEHGGYFDHAVPPEAAKPDDVPPHSVLQDGGPLRWLLRGLGDWTKLQRADTSAPGAQYDRLGFRVPAVVVSPYARANHVSPTVYDHTSALKLIEEKWNLPPLTHRDAAANSPLDMLDLAAPPHFAVPPDLPSPAKPWGEYPRVSTKLRMAQRLGVIGRRARSSS